MFTKPKLILPFQIARITEVISHLERKLRGTTDSGRSVSEANPDHRRRLRVAAAYAQGYGAPGIPAGRNGRRLRCQLESGAFDPAQFEQPDQSLFNQVVRA